MPPSTDAAVRLEVHGRARVLKLSVSANAPHVSTPTAGKREKCAKPGRRCWLRCKGVGAPLVRPTQQLLFGEHQHLRRCPRARRRLSARVVGTRPKFRRADEASLDQVHRHVASRSRARESAGRRSRTRLRANASLGRRPSGGRVHTHGWLEAKGATQDRDAYDLGGRAGRSSCSRLLQVHRVQAPSRGDWPKRDWTARPRVASRVGSVRR